MNSQAAQDARALPKDVPHGANTPTQAATVLAKLEDAAPSEMEAGAEPAAATVEAGGSVAVSAERPTAAPAEAAGAAAPDDSAAGMFKVFGGLGCKSIVATACSGADSCDRLCGEPASTQRGTAIGVLNSVAPFCRRLGWTGDKAPPHSRPRAGRPGRRRGLNCGTRRRRRQRVQRPHRRQVLCRRQRLGGKGDSCSAKLDSSSALCG